MVDWGPKPFKSLNCWFMEEGFLKMVDKWWASYEVNGWVTYVIKEKLKYLKRDLRKWHKECFGDVQQKTNDVVQKINDLDIKDEEEGMEVKKVDERRDLLGNFWRIFRRHDSILHQK